MGYEGQLINSGASVAYEVVNTPTQVQAIQVSDSVASAFIKDILFSNTADFAVLVTPTGGTVSIDYSPNNKNFYAFTNGSAIPATSQAPLTSECSATGDINYIRVSTASITGALYIKVIIGTMFSFIAKPGSGGTVTVSNFPTNPGGTVVGQAKVAVAGTAVQLPSNALVNGLVIKASASNAAPIWVGASGVTNTDDGTGNGYKLTPGEAISFAVTNSNAIYINSTSAGAFVYFSGN